MKENKIEPKISHKLVQRLHENRVLSKSRVDISNMIEVQEYNAQKEKYLTIGKLFELVGEQEFVTSAHCESLFQGSVWMVNYPWGYIWRIR